jgi:hypothetical protein
MAAWILLALRLWLDVSPDPGRPAGLHVRIDQGGGLSSQQLRIVVAEIQKIWGIAGVQVTTGAYGDPVPSDRAIVSMRVVSLELPPSRAPILGWVTADVHRQLTPTIFISLSAVGALLAAGSYKGLSFNAQPVVLRERLTAQAIGRVAAHELGHYFLRTNQHDEHGLMRRTYSTPDLTGPGLERFQIQPAGRSTVRLEVAALTARQASNIPLLDR